MVRTSSLPIAQDVSFATELHDRSLLPLVRGAVTTLQINVGKLCNQACHHCHVDAGPKRTERMTRPVADRLIELMDDPEVVVVDITGGAPELNANFRRLVEAARARDKRVIDRCNLTVLSEPGQEDLAEFLAKAGVEVTASLPCYGPQNVDAQRGKGVFERSIDALQRLNALGYGTGGGGLRLDLVYNPQGAFLPPPQAALEADYKRNLASAFGVQFDSLLTITNMPIRRFAHQLEREGRYADYMSLLVSHFNPGTLGGLMCKSMVSVGYDGLLHDCDFNQMLNMPLGGLTSLSIWDIDNLGQLRDSVISTGGHCFGCTAGAGSSCGGALA